MRSSTSLRLLSCLLVVMFVCFLCLGQQPSGGAASLLQTDTPQKPINVDMPNMDVAVVLKYISDAGGWTIIPSGKVTTNAKVSLWSKGATARQLLDKLCLVNGYVYKEDEGNIIYLMTKEEYEQVFGGVTRTFMLNFQKAESIKPLIESSLTKSGKVAIDPWSNTLVITDTVENLKRIESLIVQLDQRLVQKRFQLTHARATEVAQTIERMYPREGSVQPDIRNNSILVFGSPGYVAKVEELIARLDQDSITKVFSIRFRPAAEVARQLSNLLGSSGGYGATGGSGATSTSGTSTTGAAPTPSSSFVSSFRSTPFDPIAVSETANQIIATGSAADINRIGELIQELDSQVIVTTVPLKRLKAASVLPQIAHLASRPENITVDSQGNSLIIRDNSNNVEEIRKVLSDLDEALVTKVITLKFALASDIQNVLGALVTNPEAFRADPRTNQIVITDSESQVARMESIVAKLDSEDAYFTRTFHLQNATASKVAGIIETFLSRQRPQQTAAAPDRGLGNSPAAPGAGAPGSPVSPPAAPRGPRGETPSQSMGSAPGLAGIRAPARPEAGNPPASPVGPQPAAPAVVGPPSEGEPSGTLGTAGMAVADDRSNTVTITETLTLLTKIEELIHDLDVPVNAYHYTAQFRQLDAKALDKMIPNLLRPQEDSYFLDEQTRSIHFTTIPSMAERLTSVLKEWDRPAKQVLIRAKILTVSVSALKDIGVSFDSTLGMDGSNLTVQTRLPSQVTADRAGSFTLQKLTGTQFEAVVRALESDSHSRILANPRILTMDNSPAEVRTATDQPFTETSVNAANGAAVQDVKFLQVGTVLQVTPRIKEDHTIEMDIALDVSSLVEIRNGIPVVNRNIASSSVAVRDNHVLMIGGLRFDSDISVKEQVPILGDIPLLNLLFRSERKERQESELILFLQPTIVDASEGTERSPDPDELKDNPYEDFGNG